MMRFNQYKLHGRSRKYQAENLIFGLLVNPKLPPDFYCCEDVDRTESELQKWFGIAFVTGDDDKGYTLWRLDGGSHDRPTMYGYFNNFGDVIAHAINNYLTFPRF